MAGLIGFIQHDNLQIVNESVRINGQSFDATKSEYLVTIDLGSTLEAEIHADGVPEVVYEWFKLPSGGYSNYSPSFSLDKRRIHITF